MIGGTWEDNAARRQLALNLRFARGRAGLSQTALAEKIGVAHSTISGAEAGKQELSAVKLIRWANACGIPLSEIGMGIR